MLFGPGVTEVTKAKPTSARRSSGVMHAILHQVWHRIIAKLRAVV
jgi:hypothetical protein